MKILVDEEYGYRRWTWEPEQQTPEELGEYFSNLDPHFFNEEVFFDPTLLGGKWTEIVLDEEQDMPQQYAALHPTTDGTAHVHQTDDSWIKIGGKVYRITDPARKIAEQWLENPEIIDDLSQSLQEEPEEW